MGGNELTLGNFICSKAGHEQFNLIVWYAGLDYDEPASAIR